ncbi:MAG TPA: NAD-dependent epimerase/dehydratase family protein, partial [Longimicrobiales bacterium]|nr:NAD-dependent epimerase/dehydratase family protein [Longimicrobiales bacterium]
MSAPGRMRRVFLLGGTGFIGSRVLAALRRDPEVRVRVLGHRNVPYRELEDVDLVTGSLTSFDLGWIERFEPDTIILLARLSGRRRLRRIVAAARGERANRRLVGWLARRAPDVRVVYVSGTLVYGNHGDAEVDERTPLSPIAYAREYVKAERPWMEA